MNRNFLIGLVAGLLTFTGINILAAHLSSDCGLLAVFRLDACADDIVRAGWPLQFYEEGGFAFRRDFNPLFLWIDITIGVALSLIASWIYVRNKKALSK